MQRSDYGRNEVIRMVATYEQLRETASTRPGRGLRDLARLADLNRALDRLPMDLWKVMLVHGLLGVTQQDSGQALSISQQAVGRRFRHAIEELLYHMNGGDIGQV